MYSISKHTYNCASVMSGEKISMREKTRANPPSSGLFAVFRGDTTEIKYTTLILENWDKTRVLLKSYAGKYILRDHTHFFLLNVDVNSVTWS